MKAFTFTIPAGLTPGACAAKDNTRFSLSSVLALPTAAGGLVLCATDGKCLSLTPVDSAVPPDGPVFLPPAACKEGEVIVNGEVRHAKIGARGAAKVTVYPPADCEGRFPAARTAFPRIDDTWRAVALDTRLLAKVATATGHGNVVLFVGPDKHQDGRPTSGGEVVAPIAVVGMDCDMNQKGIGLVMPLTCNRESALAYLRETMALAPQDSVKVEQKAPEPEPAPEPQVVPTSEPEVVPEPAPEPAPEPTSEPKWKYEPIAF